MRGLPVTLVVLALAIAEALAIPTSGHTPSLHTSSFSSEDSQWGSSLADLATGVGREADEITQAVQVLDTVLADITVQEQLDNGRLQQAQNNVTNAQGIEKAASDKKVQAAAEKSHAEKAHAQAQVDARSAQTKHDTEVALCKTEMEYEEQMRGQLRSLVATGQVSTSDIGFGQSFSQFASTSTRSFWDDTENVGVGRAYLPVTDKLATDLDVLRSDITKRQQAAQAAVATALSRVTAAAQELERTHLVLVARTKSHDIAATRLQALSNVLIEVESSKNEGDKERAGLRSIIESAKQQLTQAANAKAATEDLDLGKHNAAMDKILGLMKRLKQKIDAEQSAQQAQLDRAAAESRRLSLMRDAASINATVAEAALRDLKTKITSASGKYDSSLEAMTKEMQAQAAESALIQKLRSILAQLVGANGGAQAALAALAEAAISLGNSPTGAPVPNDPASGHIEMVTLAMGRSSSFTTDISKLLDQLASKLKEDLALLQGQMATAKQALAALNAQRPAAESKAENAATHYKDMVAKSAAAAEAKGNILMEILRDNGIRDKERSAIDTVMRLVTSIRNS
jgi:hypothetical protein